MTAPLQEFMTLLSDLEGTFHSTGSVSLDSKTGKVFYQIGEATARFIDFSSEVNDSQLLELAEACQPATFGLAQQDVLDETYRKAGKMDAGTFATQISPSDMGIVEEIRASLLLGDDREIRTELYKLNVYGPGAFFKAHVDTPRSDAMFGSLVIVLPTTHEGGSLVFRHDGEESTFDSATAVLTDASKGPRAAFVAFFSDVEHEVLPVISGYRITLTYNLYYTDYTTVSSSPTLTSPASDTEAKLHDALSAAVQNPSFLPRGGLLAFGLSHKYPFRRHSKGLSSIQKMLKGQDAALFRICTAISKAHPGRFALPKTAIKVYYPESPEYEDRHKEGCLLDHFAWFGDKGHIADGIEGSMVDFLHGSEGGQRVRILNPDDEQSGWESYRDIVFAKPFGKANEFKTMFVVHGNEGTYDYIYGQVCLVGTVHPM